MRKNLKIVLAIVFSVLLTLSMVACEKTPAPPNATVGEPQRNTPEVEQKVDYSKKHVFSYASVQVNEATDYNGDDFTKWWMNEYNFEWNVIAMNFDNWQEKIRIWISSGDLPDITVFDYRHGEMLNYIDQELVFRFPDNWKERWPNVAKAQELSQLGDVVANHVGGTYFLARPSFSNNKPSVKNINNMIVYLRKDWAQAVGFELKDYYTIPELLDYARLIKQKDPGKVGSRLVPLGLKQDNCKALFVQRANTFAGDDTYFFRGDDGDFHWGPAHENTLKGLRYWRTAFEEGLLHREFFSYSGSQDIEDFYVSGISGAMWYQGMARYMEMLDNNMKTNLGLSYEEAIWPCVIVSDDGVYYDYPATNFWGTILFSPNIGMEKWERYMDMLNYSASDEGQLFIRMGFEGVDWEYDASGSIKTLLPEGKDARGKYPSIYPVYHQLLVLSDDFSLINPNYREEFRQKTIDLYKLKESLSTDKSVQSMDWDIYFYSSDAKNALSFDFGREYASFIVTRENIDTAWSNWVKSYAYMIDPVLKEFKANIR